MPQDVFHWEEIPDRSFDVVISGQAFEHNPYFWISLAEIARVLVPGGLVAIVAPGAGAVHRYPFDCWRFYPDVWPAACAYVGLELVEHSMEERPADPRMTGFDWHDNLMVARAPTFTDRAAEQAYESRLAAIVATRTALPGGRTGRPGRSGARPLRAAAGRHLPRRTSDRREPDQEMDAGHGRRRAYPCGCRRAPLEDVAAHTIDVPAPLECAW